MHAAALSVLIGLLLVARGDAVTAPSSECAYFTYYFPYNPLLQSLVPSISSNCLAAYNINPANEASTCIADCQSAYTLYSQCTSSADVNAFAASTCGQFNGMSCSSQTDPNGLRNALRTQCRNSTYCSPNCSAAIAALEQYGGCCSAAVLNGPKVVCGQQPIAPCSTVVSSGSVAAPSSECAYLSYYGPTAAALSNRLPSVNAECTKLLVSLTSITQLCIPECKSYLDLYGRCLVGVQYSDYSASNTCGKFNGQNCTTLSSSTNGSKLSYDVRTACSNSTSCSSSCVSAIAALEQYGGCCTAEDLNGPKALCGQQPIAPCTTIVSSSSAAIKFNLLIVIAAMVATALGGYF